MDYKLQCPTCRSEMKIKGNIDCYNKHHRGNIFECVNCKNLVIRQKSGNIKKLSLKERIHVLQKLQSGYRLSDKEG